MPTSSLAGVTDVHIHLQPFERGRPEALALIRQRVKDLDTLMSKLKDPRTLLDHLDAVGVERACLISYPAPEVLGFEGDLNTPLADFARADPKRLLPIGSVHPKFTKDPQREVEHLVSIGIRALKVHPPHQLYASNAYADGGLPILREIYAAAEKVGLPVMVHTGTSVFPGARNKFGDPMGLDDVAQDFPGLKLIMAHGGRPLWCPTAYFLVRRHSNLYLDISGIPPRRLLEYFPRLEDLKDKVLFGSDWPGPDVPGIREEIEAISALPLSEEFREKLFVQNARRLFP